MKTSRGSGPGGQHRNKTESAVTITHIPTGIVVYCADSRSQYDNRVAAREELERRLTKRAESAQAKTTNAIRVKQANAERSAKCFTWNMQRGVVTDHSSGKSWRLKDFARGKI